jgi:hypothetical protein
MGAYEWSTNTFHFKKSKVKEDLYLRKNKCIVNKSIITISEVTKELITDFESS